MDSATKELIKACLDKAGQKLTVARKLLASDDYDDAISRAYYAAFHAVRALLVSAGQQPTTHYGAVTLFHLLFVKTGKIANELGRYLVSLKDERENVDYGLFADADNGTASTAVMEAERLLVAAAAYLKHESFLD